MDPLVNQSPLQERTQASIEKLEQRQRVFSQVAPGLWGFWLANLAKESKKPLVVLLSTYEEAYELYEDLSFFVDADELGFFPHWDTLPYDNQSPNKEVVATRLASLLGLLSGQIKLVVTTPQAITQNVMPPSALLEESFHLEEGELYEREELLYRLHRMGYQRVDMVEDRGEYALRGEIIDLFPIQAQDPVRLDFFDVELESIKSFDVHSQHTKERIKSIALFPAQEILFTEESRDRAIKALAELREGTDKNQYFHVKEQIQEQIPFSGMESYLPLFYPEPTRLMDYLPQGNRLVLVERDKIRERLDHFGESLLQEYQYSRQEGNPTVDPHALYQENFEFWRSMEESKPLELESMDHEGGFSLMSVGNQAASILAMSPEDARKTPVRRILEQVISWHRFGAKIALAAGSRARADHLRQMIQELGLTVGVEEDPNPAKHMEFLSTPVKSDQPSLVIFTSRLNRGFRWVDASGQTCVGLFSEEEIFGPKQKKRRVKNASIESFFSSLGDLKSGDYVVHVEYGIGVYEGLKKIQAGAHDSDFMVISYRGGDKVYVPIDKFHLVQKFTGTEGQSAKLNKLGDASWTKTKSKVKSEVDDMAEELIKIYAKREAERGVSFSPDSSMIHEFEMGFPYSETDDQQKAIEEVKQDMESERPMDRLICGDVGFGKTEVAMRAAIKAVVDGFQVGVLAPTTILAQQHFENFAERFQDFPVKVAVLSRFQTPKQVKETLAELKEGKVDILVGTHRLLSKDVIFKKLGLLVVDEEQRFGVRHKETIKKLKASVDCLTLSATPIPRTLHMSLIGIRDITVINTPPMDRRAIRTRLMKLNDYVITEAVEREMRRGGQVFFIHNRVESIMEVAGYLNSIMPRIRLGVAHGQMSEKELDEVMHSFIRKETDLLLATTIVESGLDIPNANTIIINNADQLGLSQLYQLRGRVGRSKAQAYCYLLTPKEKLLSEVAKKRLNILSELNHLGAGFKLASYDLELRGAGDVLGSKQSGHIAQVGFELYTQMIQEAVRKLQRSQTEEVPKDRDIKLTLEAEAGLPESYIPSMNQRLDAYKRISSITQEEELWAEQESLEDRFGKMPEMALNLFAGMRIKLLGQALAVQSLSLRGSQLDLDFYPDFQPDPEKLFAFMARFSQAKLTSESSLYFQLEDASSDGLIQFLKEFQSHFANDGNDQA